MHELWPDNGRKKSFIICGVTVAENLLFQKRHNKTMINRAPSNWID